MDFMVRRDDLRHCRFEETPVPEVEPGGALLAVEAFGLTSNNVTYAVMGDAMSYWSFFPAAEGWGRIPVWGFARVLVSAHDAVDEGTRVFGYLPPSTHLIVAPDRVDAGGFIDGSPHRAKLPPVYNSYVRAAGGSEADRRSEDQQILFRPLFGTSFLIDDFLAEHAFFGADRIVVSSASSKTALGTAFLLAPRDGIEVVGLTSAARTDFVDGLGVYDRVVAYDALASLPEERTTVYVDISGDGELRAAVHRHLGESLAHDCLVGASHWDRLGGDMEGLPGPDPQLFFAPDRMSKRTADWGPDGLQARIRDAWGPFGEWLSGWLQVLHGSGPEAIERVYLELLDGRAPPSIGYVMTLGRPELA
jgi:hypothetical protein